MAPLAPPETAGRGIENYILLCSEQPPTAAHPSRISSSPVLPRCYLRAPPRCVYNRPQLFLDASGRARYTLTFSIPALPLSSPLPERFQRYEPQSEVHYTTQQVKIQPYGDGNRHLRLPRFYRSRAYTFISYGRRRIINSCFFIPGSAEMRRQSSDAAIAGKIFRSFTPA